MKIFNNEYTVNNLINPIKENGLRSCHMKAAVLLNQGKDSIEASSKSKGCLSFIKDFIVAFLNLITCNVFSAKKGDKRNNESSIVETRDYEHDNDRVFTYKDNDKEFKIGQLKALTTTVEFGPEYSFNFSDGALDALNEKIMNQLLQKIIEQLDPVERITIVFPCSVKGLIDVSLFDKMEMESTFLARGVSGIKIIRHALKNLKDD